MIQVNSELALLSISWSMKDKRYTTNGLARAAGCTRKALRVYQAQGLMKRPEKTWQACFDQHAVDRLRLIMTLRHAGLSIAEIAALLRTRDERIGGGEQAQVLAVALDEVITGVNRRISELEGVRDQLAAARGNLIACSTCAEETLEACLACIDEKGYDPITRALLVPRASG